ncbi:hypothetical protein vseg_008536 [Gypsophila vaccaria]
MTSNVFGEPVTNTTLRNMREFYEESCIEARERARVALEAKNVEEKETKARQFNEAGLQAISNGGVGCLIYNATGGPLTLVAVFEYAGWISEPSHYPTLLLNGQWAAFVHAKDYDRSSNGALVYEATQYPQSQWVLGWYKRGSASASSKCYVELRPSGYYSMDSPDSTCHALRGLICGSKFIHNTGTSHDAIFSSIGNSATPIYEAILTKTEAML